MDKKPRGRPKGTAIQPPKGLKVKGGTKLAKSDHERMMSNGDQGTFEALLFMFHLADSSFPELVFFVPLGSSKGQGRVPMSMQTGHESAFAKLYATMECNCFCNKPPLMYSMKGTGRGGVRLQDESDWTGLKAHLCTICKTDLTINITIKADDDVIIQAMSS